MHVHIYIDKHRYIQIFIMLTLCIRKGDKIFAFIHILLHKETLEECLPRVSRREWGRWGRSFDFYLKLCQCIIYSHKITSNIYVLVHICTCVCVCVFEIIRKWNNFWQQGKFCCKPGSSVICYVILPPTFILDTIKINIYLLTSLLQWGYNILCDYNLRQN